MNLVSCSLGLIMAELLGGALAAVTTLDPAMRRVDQPAPKPPNPIVVDNAKRLFADDWVIQRMSGLQRTLHPVKKHPKNPIFKPEKPWEKPAVLLFGTLMYDPNRHNDKFRMWYLCFTPEYNADYSQRKNKNGRIAYAISQNGIDWERPNLGVHEYKGSRQNNIVIPGRPDSTSIIYDPRDSNPNRRYKAQIRNGGHHAYFSADGIHWTDQGRINIDGYDRSTVHWDPIREHWFATTKSPYKTSGGAVRRGRGYQQSRDFLHWGPVSFLCATPEDASDIVYNLEPFYYESLFFGIWGRYTAEPHALLDVQLAVSHNGKHWERPSSDPWIPLSPLPKDFVRVKKPYITPVTGVDPFDPRVPWDYGNNSGSSLGPVRVGDELWMYYSGRTSDHRSTPNTGAIGLGTLRLDGFFSLDAGKAAGTLLTCPLRFVNKTLHVNADAQGGELRVEVLDESRKPIPPFTRENCTPLTTDSVRHLVRWNGAKDLRSVLGKSVRLRFFLKQAELYAFWTGEERRWHTPDTTTWLSSVAVAETDTHAAVVPQPKPAKKQPAQQPKPSTDRSLFPRAYGVLASEKLMFPVDMSDWPIKITSERQLFVDDYLIASRSKLTRQLHQLQRYPGNPVLRLREKPWEHGFGHSVFVLRDPQSRKFRMWYNLRHFVTDENGLRYRGPMCYAESDDGIRWTKPNLGIFRYGQDKNNNITLPQGTIDGLFYEPDDPDQNKRYKALVWHDPGDQKAYAPREGFYLYWSPDGIHWQGDNQRCIIPNGQGANFPAELLGGVGDTTNFRWDSKLNKYVANLKILFRSPTLRTVGHSESEDLIHWTRPRMAMHRDALDEPDSQMYEHITFGYESMWIGLPRVMHTKRTGWKQVEAELSCSRDGRHWTRVARGQRFLPLGAQSSWDADYLIPGRPGAPLLIDGKLRFYYWGTRRVDKRDGSKTVRWSMHIGLATLRRDGFVSLGAAEEPGTVITRPLTFAGKKLYVNVEAAEGGYVKVAVLTSKNETVKNYALNDCQPVTTDAVRAPVSWRIGSDIPLPAGKHVRLQFELKNAKLYSFWIE